VNIAEKNLREILVDHAYCEQKAASSCISLIVQFPEREKLVELLTPVVTEEWKHFEQVLEKLRERGWPLGFPRKDEYIEQLSGLMKKGGGRDEQLTERLLLNALIEARSCERFRLLSKELHDAALASFYRELMVSEAGHYKLFLSLAKEYDDPVKVERRWREMLAGEADIMRQLAVRSDRLH
jgi:tRNA-(ms[2]io[6]A)-hydroxylase